MRTEMASLVLILMILLMTNRSIHAESAFYPLSGAKDVCVDSPLKMHFEHEASLGESGTIQLVDVSTGTVVETIDLAPFAEAEKTPATTPAKPSPAILPSSKAAPAKTKNIGGILYRYYPVLAWGNEVLIVPNQPLEYGKKYGVKIEAGAIKSNGFNGIADANLWTFTTKEPASRQLPQNITVSADGSGDFATVQGAIDAIPPENVSPITVLVKKGVYTELLFVNKKDNVTIVGEDRAGTVIEYSTNNVTNDLPPEERTRTQPNHGYRRGVLRVDNSNDFVLANLTVRNSTPKGGSQAEAIIFNNPVTARAIVANVDLYSFQDTLQINGQAYLTNCYIEGDVDFLWGKGPCFFENCVARSVTTAKYYTQIRNPATNHGFVFYKCVFDGIKGVTRNVLSRIDTNVFPHSEVVLIDCVVTDAVNPAGWLLDKKSESKDQKFYEFNSHNPDGSPIDVSHRIAASKQLRQPEDAETIKNYSDPIWVLGENWDPRATKLPKMPKTEANRPQLDGPTPFDR